MSNTTSAPLAQLCFAYLRSLWLLNLEIHLWGRGSNSSHLFSAKELSVDVEKRVRTLQKLVDGQQQVTGEVPVEADSRPITEVYDTYFAKQ